MGQGQNPQGHLLGVPLPEFPRGMTGLGDGCGDLGWGKLDNSAVTLFDLFNHGYLLGCNIRFWWFETTKKNAAASTFSRGATHRAISDMV
jgi:hypothetical protein